MRHCWHATGAFLTTLMNGVENNGTEIVQCCYCGIEAQRRWQDVRHPLTGHGRHAFFVFREYEPLDSYGDCYLASEPSA